MKMEKNNNSVHFKNKNNGINNDLYKISKNLNIRVRITNFHIFIYLITFIIAAVCYINSLNGDFVHDDIYAIKRNLDVTGHKPFLELFSNDFWGRSMRCFKSHKSYRPITVLTFRLTYWLFGPEPFYFHIVNVILHSGITCLFVYICHHVLRLCRATSFLAGVLLAIHPIHTEAVSGIVGRAELLSCALFLTSFICYTRSLGANNATGVHMVGPSMFILCLLTSAVAMLCKETGVTALGVCLLYDILVLSRAEVLRVCKSRSLSASIYPLTRRILTISGFIVLLLGLRFWVMGGELPIFLYQDNPASFSESFQTRFLTYSFLWAYNGWLLMAPVALSYDWQGGSIPLVENFGDLRNLATVVAVLIVSCLIFTAYKNFRKKDHNKEADPILLSLIFMIVPFLPASNLFFRVGFVLAERVLYIPSLGFCLFVSSGFVRLCSRWRLRQPLLLSGITLLLLLHAGKTWSQNRIWLSREALFKSGVARMPHNAKVHYNYANFLKDTGDLELARHHYRTTVRLDPVYASAHNNLGTLLDNKTEAEGHFREALKAAPSHPGAHVNLGNTLFKRGEHAEGLRLLYKALELDNLYMDALLSISSAQMELGNFQEAEKYLRTAQEASPDNVDVYIHYGALMEKKGDYNTATSYYKKVLEMDRRHSEALIHAAYAYNKLGNMGVAENLLKQAISVKRNIYSLEQLATLYFRTGRVDESLGLYEEIETMAPNTTETLIRYGNVLGTMNKLDKAESVFLQVLRLDHQNIEAFLGLSMLLSKQAKYEQSKEYLSSAIEVSEISGKTERLTILYFERANNYKDLSMYTEALQDYNKTLELDPNHVKAHANSGTIYHIWGEGKKALYHYKAALRLDPSNSIVIENLQKLEKLRH